MRGVPAYRRDAAFLLGGNDLARRFSTQLLLGPEHVFAKHNLLRLAYPPGEDGPLMKALPGFQRICSASFPAASRGADVRLGISGAANQTRLGWDDLVLHPTTRRSIEEIQTWIEHGRR